MTNFAPTADDYARHRKGFPDRFFHELEKRGVLVPGGRAVDLGTGTGGLALGWACRGMEVTAVDIAAPLLAQAQAEAQARRVALRCVEASAEATGLPAGAYDLVSAGQCWHWFDRSRAAAEAARLLTAGGRLIIAHLDWLPHDATVDLTMRAMEEFGARFPEVVSLGRCGLYPAWLEDVMQAGFQSIETFSFDVDLLYSHADWRGRIRASAAVGGAFPPAEVARFDEILARSLRKLREPLPVAHRVWAVLAERPRG